MKKSLSFIILLSTVVFITQAQDYKKFKAGVGLGYAFALGQGPSGGIIHYFEPAYRVSDQLVVGLRFERALFVRGFTPNFGSFSDFDKSGIVSYTVNGQYYFSSNRFRPFAGLGFGLYNLAAISVGGFGQTIDEVIEAAPKFGFYPRVGFDVWHFTLQAEFNLIPKSITDFGGGEVESQNSYLAIKTAFFFGGGKN